MKNRIWLLGLGVLCFLAVFGMTAAYAAQPTGAEPGSAPYLDADFHTLAPHSSTWSRFEFVVDSPGFLCRFFACPDRDAYHGYATIRLNGMARSGLAFEVYAPPQVSAWGDTDPVGRSSDENGDLVWSGESDANGTRYVRVVNDRSYAITFRFTVSGVRIALSRDVQLTATPWSVAQAIEAARHPTPAPPPRAVAAQDNTNPARAALVSGLPQEIPVGGDRWFIAAFPMTPDNIIVRLADGNQTGLVFEVYLPSQAETWWKEDPIGRGESLGDDLIWSGAPDGVDRRLIRVVNRTSRPVEYVLLIESPRQPADPVLPFGGIR